MSGKGKGPLVVYRGKGDRRTVIPYRRKAKLAMARNLLRYAMRNYGKKIANRVQKAARQKLIDANRNYYRVNRKRYTKIRGMASGSTHTTTRMIVRKTPKQQRFIRKIFKNKPLKNMFVNRFGFAWMASSEVSKTIWYSVTHMKFNNVHDYMRNRVIFPSTTLNNLASQGVDTSSQAVGNTPDNFIYIGKCTYTYEIYNPTNYIMTVYIYDLICKHDTPWNITYNNSDSQQSNAPENCMRKSATSQVDNGLGGGPPDGWVIADPTLENDDTTWNFVGMKPTDYHYFNLFWKVKGMKKIILPPTTSHHHVVVFNPKIKITKASLYMPRQKALTDEVKDDKRGIAGLTQATLFGFQGQIACEDNLKTDSDNATGTLPGKLLVNCIKKENIYNVSQVTTNIIQRNNLKTSFTAPHIFTDLVETTATST